MDKTPLLSLCIPTNGVIEWVFPVLDSIFSQNVDSNLYEVVVTDNGNNQEFKNKFDEYKKNHNNLFYYRSSGYEFLSEPDSYKNANGTFIKFINHRTKLIPGALQYFIDWINSNLEEKPFIYFTNKVLKTEKTYIFDSFDGFVKGLSYWSSWSTGMGFWKKDFDELESLKPTYNFLFPHTTILFSQKKPSKYIIDDKFLLDEIPLGKIPKGRYNLFFTFGVEYVGILTDLLREKYISCDTFLYVKKQNKKFIANLYYSYIILKKKCSYDLTNYKKSLNVYYNLNNIRVIALLYLLKQVVIFPLRCMRKIYRMIRRK